MTKGFVRFAVFFIALVLITSAAGSFLATTFLPVPPDFPAPKVKPLVSQYLFTSIYLGDPQETKIFLIAANPRYGYYKDTPNSFISPQEKKWDQCLILNVTIRNDYSESHPFPLDTWNPWNLTDGYYITVATALYSKDGSVRILYEAIPTGESLYVPTVKLKTGETTTFDLYVATTSRDIDHFELYIMNIGGPPPTPM